MKGCCSRQERLKQAVLIRTALGLKRKRQVDPTLLLDRFQRSTGRPVPGSGMREDDVAGREVAAHLIANFSIVNDGSPGLWNKQSFQASGQLPSEWHRGLGQRQRARRM